MEMMRVYEANREAADSAFAIYREYCGDRTPPRVPGMDTVIRLAWRIAHGKTSIEAAAREYVYRWSLAIKSPDQCIGVGTRNPCVSVFGAPHTIGM